MDLEKIVIGVLVLFVLYLLILQPSSKEGFPCKYNNPLARWAPMFPFSPPICKFDTQPLNFGDMHTIHSDYKPGKENVRLSGYWFS